MIVIISSRFSCFNMPYWVVIWTTEDVYNDNMLANGYVDDFDEVTEILMSDEFFRRPYTVAWIRGWE